MNPTLTTPDRFLKRVREAESVIRKVFPPTPLIAAPHLSERFGAEIYLKLECLSPIRTFKLRGALAKLAVLPPDAAVVTASSGNHGLAVARAARLSGRKATICVPDRANPVKVSAIRAEGARLIPAGRDYDDAQAKSVEIAAAEGLILVPAFDDVDVIAGQGTAGLEIADAGWFDTVITGVGGGGFIGGVARVLKELQPETTVVGVEPEGSDSMTRSVEAGQLITMDRVETIADGLTGRRPGNLTFPLVQRYVDRMVRVPDSGLLEAMRVLLRDERLVCEPAGAAGLAALLTHGVGGLGRKICLIVTGGNVADDLFHEILLGAAR